MEMTDIKAYCIGDKDHTYCPDRMKCKRFHDFMAEFTQGTLERTPEQLKELLEKSFEKNAEKTAIFWADYIINW